MSEKEFDFEPEIDLEGALEIDAEVVDAGADAFETDPAPAVDPVKQAGAAKTTVNATKAVATTTAGTVATPPAFSFDFGELVNLPGVVMGDIGLEVSRFPVERAKFTVANKSLISIISQKVVAVKTHYDGSEGGLGSYLCFGGKCCERDGLPRIKYLHPIVQYDTNKAGKPVSTDLGFKVLAIGKEQYGDVMSINDLNGDVTDVDLLVTCNDEQYQKITLLPAGACRWKKAPQLVQQVQEFWSEHMKDLIKAVARTVTERDFNKAATQGDIAPTDSDIKFDDIFESK